MDKLKKQIEEILEIVKLCPENLQEKCFEFLFKSTIEFQQTGKKTITTGETGAETIPPPEETTITSGSEIEAKDIHTKAKRIIPSSLALEEVNNIFYKENGEILPLYDELKSPKVSEAQMRVALMEALKNGLKTGDFSFNTKTIKTLCETYKCYDSSNFSVIFKRNKELFNEDYKMDGMMSLTSEGKTEMVKIAKELAK